MRSIFIGGGTPSLLSGKQIERIMLAVRNAFFIMEEAEITMETNPGTLTKENVFSYKKAGVNRFSMGLQSADDACLHLLGRIHTWEEFLKSYELARKAGFENINVDLMSGLPGQTVSIYRRTLEKVMALQPEHISAYSLILEEGTPFGESEEIQKKIPDEETDREMYQLTKEVLAENGYERYEISNYARKGKECIHNLGYWSGIPYLGFGLGASSYFEGTRFSNEKNLEKYQKKPSQVILRWLRQSNMIAIPKSVHKERIEENFDIDSFMLDQEDMIRISQMDTGRSQILDIRSLLEVYRLFHIRFEQ